MSVSIQCYTLHTCSSFADCSPADLHSLCFIFNLCSNTDISFLNSSFSASLFNIVSMGIFFVYNSHIKISFNKPNKCAWTMLLLLYVLHCQYFTALSQALWHTCTYCAGYICISECWVNQVCMIIRSFKSWSIRINTWISLHTSATYHCICPHIILKVSNIKAIKRTHGKQTPLLNYIVLVQKSVGRSCAA